MKKLLLSLALLPGVYSGPAPDHVGSLILEVYPDQSAIFRRVVSIHLPPAELETKRVQIKSSCFDPAPSTIERCAVATSSATITVVNKPGGQKVVLKRGAAVSGKTAPEAKPKS